MGKGSISAPNRSLISLGRCLCGRHLVFQKLKQPPQTCAGNPLVESQIHNSSRPKTRRLAFGLANSVSPASNLEAGRNGFYFSVLGKNNGK